MHWHTAIDEEENKHWIPLTAEEARELYESGSNRMRKHHNTYQEAEHLHQDHEEQQTNESTHPLVQLNNRSVLEIK